MSYNVYSVHGAPDWDAGENRLSLIGVFDSLAEATDHVEAIFNDLYDGYDDKEFTVERLVKSGVTYWRAGGGEMTDCECEIYFVGNNDETH